MSPLRERLAEIPPRRRILWAGMALGTLTAAGLALAPEIESVRAAYARTAVALPETFTRYEPGFDIPLLARVEAPPAADARRLPAPPPSSLGFFEEDVDATAFAQFPPAALLGPPLPDPAREVGPAPPATIAGSAETVAPALPAVSAVGPSAEAGAAPEGFELIEPEEIGDGANCILAPWEVVEIKSVVRGRIEALPAERGDRVAAGDTIVVLDSRAERAAAELARARAAMQGAVRSRQAALALGKRRSDRTGQLFERRAVGQEALDQAETEAALARYELEQARDERRLASLDVERALAVLDQRRIESPISGVVLERFLADGEVVDHEPILRIAQIDPLRVELILPADRFGSVRTGMSATVVPEIPGDREHRATVEIVDPVIDPASGTFGVRLKLPNPDFAVPSGLGCQVRFRE